MRAGYTAIHCNC